ncbi:hypothetical protein MLD38_022216 [Melastoma candidum]|uniref:Uncharacterized protein n=1 Tax=Melastoma candidum TaxID=119954 RepID=A0ACB9QIF4_9MYRT|nr:hypothetical protein MLD38_022216 [Melastoma candidum]
MLFLLALAVPFFILLFSVLHQHGVHRAGPPGPWPLPLIGNLHLLNHSSLHRCLWQLSLLHGPLMSLQLGLRPALVISSAKVAEKALKHCDLEFSNRPSMFGPSKISYGCSDIGFAPYGDHWRKVRRITMPHLFTAKKVRSFRAVREQEVARTIQGIIATSVRRGGMVNIGETVLPLALSIICRIAFGRDYAEEVNGRELLREVQAALGGLFLRDYFGWLGGLVDRLREATWNLERVFEEMDAFYEKMIEEHRQNQRHRHQRRVRKLPEEEEEEDTIDVLLGDGNLTVEQVKAVLMDLIIGGTDTNSATLEWAMTALMKNPRVMVAAQQEMRALLQNKGRDWHNGMVNEDDLDSLPYLKAVVKEALRLYPPAPLLIPRETVQVRGKTVIDGYEIRPKTMVYVNAWAIGRDPDVWGEDAEEFLPERFLTKGLDRNEFGFLAFGAGRRKCPGMDMGIGIVELALANMLYRFDWELPEGVREEDIDVNVQPGITMHRKTELFLVARECTL